MTETPLAAWHRLLESRNPDGLGDLLAEDASFHSPVVFAPQRGKTLTRMYLTAAFHVLGNDSFHYVRQVIDGNDAVLEFEVELDGTSINGVDMIHWNEQGLIDDFKVLIRPWRALDVLRQRMMAMLESGPAGP